MVDSYFLGSRVLVKTGDITKENCDAIVNAANSSLLGGGGVDGAIHRAGGPAILEACREIRKKKLPGGLPDGEAVITTGGNLPAPFVIHTVGPIWYGGNSGEPQKLASCYQNSLKIALQNHLKSIAFPAISTGIFGYPPDKAALISSNTIKTFLIDHLEIEKVIFIFFSDRDKNIFLQNHSFD